MDKKIILLIILLFFLVTEAGVNFVNVHPGNVKIEVLGFISATSFYSTSSSTLLYTLCDLDYPILVCTYTDGNFATDSKTIYILDLRDNSNITIQLNYTVIGALVYFNGSLNIARIYYVEHSSSSSYYYIKYFDVFFNNRTITSPTIIYYGIGSQTSTIGFYYREKYSFLYALKRFYLFLNKTNGFFTYNISLENYLIPLGDYIIKIPCYSSTAGYYDITVYTAFFENPFENPKKIYSHHTSTSSCEVLAVITNFAPFITFYHSYDSLYEGFTLQFTKILYDANKKYNISAINKASGFMQVDTFYSYSYFYGLILNRRDIFIYNNKSYYISHIFETREICDGCGIMVLNDVNIRNNTIFLLVRKNPNIEGYYLDLLFNEDFYYNVTGERNAMELFGALSSNLGNVILNIFNNETYKTFSIPISTSNNGAITSGKFIYFEKATHENVSITVSFQNTNLAPAHLYPISTQNILINPRTNNLVYFNLQNVQDCENYVINILGVPAGLNNYMFFRNAKFDFSCRAMVFLRPFDRVYKIAVYEQGNKVYETGGFYITQSEYFIRISNQGSGGNIVLDDINITYSCNLYNVNETHAKHSCSAIANKQVNFKYVVKHINTFLNSSNIECDYEANDNIVAFECQINKNKNYNMLLYANNNIVYSDFISFQSSNNIGFTSQENLIVVLFFILVLGLITAFNPVLGLFIISVGLFILYFIGFLSINIIGLSSLVFLFAVLVYLFRHKLIYGE
ncbi:MAG: hypothetical protein QXJ14_02725 [Candidatus Aenigmatarchaeota archaeon]